MQTGLLAGKVAIVTGASRGIGRAVALTLARNGAGVSLAARTETQLDEIRSEIAAFGGEAAVFPKEIADIVLFLVTRRGNAVIDQVNVRRAASTPWG
jgi:NADP-dependent 3-hydroxy acid dehydrogenase YdfG